MMEDYLYKTPDTYRMIRVLFGILASSVILGVVLLFVLDINETSEAKSGVLIAGDKPKEFLATAEIELEKLYAHEGAQVKIGDTIAVFRSKEHNENLYRQRNELQIEKQRIQAIKKSIGIINRQISQSESDSGNLESALSTNRSTMVIALEGLVDQIDIKKGVVQQLKEGIDRDAILLRKGAISKVAYQANEQRYNQEKSELTQLLSDFQQQKLALDNLSSTQKQDLGKQNMSILNLQSELQAKNMELKESELALFLKEQLESTLLKEINDLVVVSNIDGYVSALFNQQVEANIIAEGGLIARVTPNGSGQFYCKLNVTEESLAEIVPGQKVNIKLDAYNHYQYGVLKGKVLNIDKETVNLLQQFYVLVAVDEYDTETFRLKDGYQVSGEVILGTSRLNKYMAKKIFKKMKM